MQVEIERLPGSVVTLTVTVEPALVEEQMERLFQKHARRVTVPGFRPGKAPRKLIEERIHRGALLQDAVEEVIDVTYKQALREHELEPLERGEIDDLKTGDDLSITYTVKVPVRPDIKLPTYTGVAVQVTPTEVTEAQVDTEIENLRERAADFTEITEEGIVHGDYVTVDYTMTVNGEPYPDGETTGYPLEVGSDTFFPELNEALIGVKQGDTVKVTTTYPSEYSNKDLAGTTAEFDITVQQVRRVVKPEANDAWAALISGGALQTMDDLRARVKQNLQVMAAQADHDHVRNDILRRVVQQAELDIPVTLVDEQLHHQMHELEHRLARERMSMEEYAEHTNRTVEAIEEEQELMARDMVRRSLVLQEIAKREEIAITEDDLNALAQMANRDNRPVKTVRAELEKSGQLDHLASRLFHEKVLSFLEQHAEVVRVDAEGNPLPEPPAAPEAAKSEDDVEA